MTSVLGFGNGTKSLPPTGLRFDIADLHFQMPLAVLTAVRINVESKVTATAAAAISGLVTASIRSVAPIFRRMSAHGLRILSGINRKHLLQQVSGHPGTA